MTYLNKKDAQKIAEILAKTKSKDANVLINKLNNQKKKLIYFYDKGQIEKILRKAFREKRKVKMNYYSFSSDEVTNRIIDIYQIHDGCIVALCNLRNDERTFKIRSINKVALLDEKYEIPKGWKPESIILNK